MQPSTESINQQVQRLREHFSSGQTRSYSWRIDQLGQLKSMLVEQESAFINGLNQDLGKAEHEAWTSEIGYTVSEIEHAIKRLKNWMKPRRVKTPLIAQPAKSFQLPEPLGTVLIIGAWNYPIQLVLGPLVAAIAAGNCAVLKPSELSPNCANVVAKYLPLYLDQLAYSVVLGAIPETTELLQQKFDHILYTGGKVVAKIVMTAAAQHLTPVTLELGGKSPCIVDNAVDMDVAVSRIVWAKWMNAGQTCVAPDYVIIEHHQADNFVQKLKGKLNQFYGNNIQHNQDYGRIVNHKHLQRLLSYLAEQNIVIGGQHDIEQKYLAPTVVLSPSLDSPLMTEEIFGPILPIITVDKISQAIDMVNQRTKPLALYVFSKNTAFEQQVLSQTSAGNVCINDGMMFMANPDLPFGGVGNSGMGSYHGQAGFDTFSHLKTVMKRSTLLDPTLRYPPFNKFKLSIIKKLL